MVPFLVLYPDTLEVSSVLISSQMVVKANRLNEAHQNSLSERITAAEDYLASLLALVTLLSSPAGSLIFVAKSSCIVRMYDRFNLGTI